MIRRFLAVCLAVPAFAFLAGCENADGPKSPTSVKVDNSKDVQPPAPPAGAKVKGPSMGVVKSPD